MQENMDFGHFPNNKYCFTTFKILPWFVSVPFPFHCQTSLFETVTGSTLWASCHSNSAGLSWDQSWSYRHQTGPRQWLTCLSDGIGFLPGPLISSRLEWARSHDGGSVPKQQNPNVKALIEPLFTSHVLMVYWLKQVTDKSQDLI